MDKSNVEKGKAFEELVAQGFNLLLSLTGRNRVKPMYRSGAFKGMKGDLINLPKWLPFTVECKDWRAVNIPMFWKQVKQEAEEMGTNPWLIMPYDGEILSIKILEDDLKLLRRLRDEKANKRI